MLKKLASKGWKARGTATPALPTSAYKSVRDHLCMEMFHSCQDLHSTHRNSPPQFSRLKRLLKLWLTNGEIFFRSWVRTLVASSDWWASLKVVSISSRPWWARTALANPSGPSCSNTSRKPTGGSPSSEGERERRKGKLMWRTIQSCNEWKNNL